MNERLIPAHAGKTPMARLSPPCSRAHPRSRGENDALLDRRRRRGGSSPLTRGKLDFHDLFSLVIGLIPAHAGKTTRATARRSTSRAHPRSRGENQIDGNNGTHDGGSSPLTRGKPPRCCPGGPRTRAHPRSRGENFTSSAAFMTFSGSSPLTRGKQAGHRFCFRHRGLIPAHAGKTRYSGQIRPGHGAHPRSRGENGSAQDGSQPPGGSSPLTRGKPKRDLRCGTQSRLIPAHAGKTHPTTR